MASFTQEKRHVGRKIALRSLNAPKKQLSHSGGSVAAPSSMGPRES
jgi:hypothetical protein